MASEHPAVKVSVIVPVFNAGSRLSKAVESLLAQTLTEKEILLIDDGSTDQSGALCDRYASENSCIRVVHKPNGGVAAARQTGLELAVGEYLIGADADDWTEPRMLERLYEKAAAEEADVVICDFFVNRDHGRQELIPQRLESTLPDRVRRQLFRSLHGSCCNKLLRREIVTRYGIRFPEGVDYGEDLLFWMQVFAHDEIKIVALPEAFYHYVQYGSSITNAYTRKTWEQRIRYGELLERTLPEHGYQKEIRKVRLGLLFEAFAHGVLSNREARRLLLKNWRAAFFETSRFRHWYGYVMLLAGCYPTARRKLRY